MGLPGFKKVCVCVCVRLDVMGFFSGVTRWFYVQLSADVWRLVTKNRGYARTISGYVHLSLY